MGILYNRFTPDLSITSYTVIISVDGNINHTGGDLVQSNLSGPMTPVTLSPKDTYRINQLSGGSGITVTTSGNNYIISGTPTADVTISCTTTRNPDLLTDAQKNLSNWTPTLSTGYTSYGYTQEVSDTRINWRVSPANTARREGYIYNTNLDINTVPDGDYIFEIRYRITDLGYKDDGCKIGICTSNRNEYINSTLKCYIDILDTQTSYINVSVPYTRSNNENAYLVITNTYWSQISSSESRQGRIYLTSISLRAK